MTRKTNITRAIFASVLLLMVIPSLTPMAFADSTANSTSNGTVKISNAWARETFAMAMTGAGYFTITNKDKNEPLQLVGARVNESISDSVELHNVQMASGMMKMFEMEDGVRINPGQTIEFRPGGMHVMFMGLKKPLKAGDEVPVTLLFENRDDMLIVLQVKDVRK